MAARTLPIVYNLVVYSGTTFRLTLRWLPNGDDTPMDFTGWNATMNIGTANNPATTTLTTGGGGIDLGPDGLINVVLTAAQTEDMTVASLAYNLDLDNPNGDVNRFMRGQVDIVQDVEDAA